MTFKLSRTQIIKWLRDPASQRPETAKFLERAAELLEAAQHAAGSTPHEVSWQEHVALRYDLEAWRNRALVAEATVRDARQLLITLQFARPVGTKDPIWDELATFVANLKAQSK